MNRTLGSLSLLVAAASMVALSAALSAGCTVNQSGPAGADGGGTPDASAAAPPGLSCLKILQCIVECPDADAACPDACAEKGDAEGKATILAFAACVDKEKCTDASCTQAKCAASLNACVTSSAPRSGGSPLQGSAPPGSVPPDLVGTWSGARDGTTERLTFNADGSGSWKSSIVTSSSGGCLSYVNVTRTGNVVISESTITVHATSVVQSKRECAPPDVNTDQPAVSEEVKWSRPSDGNANQIIIIDSACAAKYPGTEDCNMAGCPIGLYCSSRLTRE